MSEFTSTFKPATGENPLWRLRHSKRWIFASATIQKVGRTWRASEKADEADGQLRRSHANDFRMMPRVRPSGARRPPRRIERPFAGLKLANAFSERVALFAVR